MDLEMPIVYVIQKQHRYDRETDSYVPKFNIEPAKKFGEFKFLLSPTAAPWRMDAVLSDLDEGLRDYTDKDHLLLIGNPTFIGCATAIAADRSGGTVRFLQWSGREKAYIPILAEIFPSEDE